ncbi:type I-E CRISPR-associated protein Cas6/Cse3/CasE [Leucobacter sp. wl10]|uniref:type I-E CRISPR-associated protein Cas6/Cse3/CasE n=1 Tax=Leucobacter sp. wl10 TaxID=2304677 RepID=UPI000E5B93FF|nr:type I-E CRISPR-associated protein Cas6/Cse3/CasE [Leucobacter sp. wl10]RGE19822.1 type I-E CRISPR-associated protein Cas6/Cse3/CasE [Leucobacter sp. wl10]
MLLTRMYLNPRRRQTVRFMRDPQALHAAVESAFPPVPLDPGSGSRLLWRLDADGDERQLLILSSRTPSLEHLQEQAGWSAEQTWESRSYDQLLSRFARGQRYAFRLTANPVHTVTDSSGRKKLLAHVSVKHQTRWLTERADDLGVRFLTEGELFPGSGDPALDQTSAAAATHGGEAASEVAAAILVSCRETLHFRRGEQRVTLARARFDGLLEVTDVNRLRDALTRGIGRAKAYGCGLMTLAPPHQAS